MKYIISKKTQEHGRILLISLICMYVNNPFYILAIESINKAIYCCFALSPIIYVITHCFISVKRGVLNYIKYIIFYILCVYAVTIISGSHDMQYTLYFFRHFREVIAMYAVYMVWLYAYKRNKISIRFEEVYIISLLLYIISTIIFLMMPTLKDIWLNLIKHYGINEILTKRQEYVTRIGIAGYSGFGVAFQTAMGLIYYAAMYVNNCLSSKKKILYLMILLTGGMFYGRIGTVIEFVILILIGIYSLIYKKKLKLLLGIVCSVTIIVTVIISIYKYGFGSAKNFVDWAFEPIINYLTNGTFTSASTSGLKQFYQQFNPSKQILWHGAGYWLNEDGSYYGHTDVGFMRNIYYGGVIFMIVTYGCVAYLIFSYFKLSKKYSHKGRWLVTILCIITFVAFELKGDITFNFVQAFLPLYLGAYFWENNIVYILHMGN